uniref:SH2 domain-containing protein n=1 Tax=Echinostoma caproni TaxID=27848 RepID=A0A183AD58_9TREM
LLENDASNADALDTPAPGNNHDRGAVKRTNPVFPSRTGASNTAATLPAHSPTQSETTKTTSATNRAPQNAANSRTTTTPTTVAFERLEPVGEPWYVGKMSRSQAESLLRYEGDFLVRASPHQPGQFVLSGMQDSKCRHLLLADPNGLVRTKERVFDSIQHLIDYHVQNGVPIRSADSEIRLIFPVSTFTFCES